MSKPMRIMLITLAVLFGAIFLYKGVMSILIKRFFASQSNPAFTVSTTTVKNSPWQPKISATGSVRAIKGVNVTTELAGMVEKIYFTPGVDVQEGTLLVQLNAGTEIGQLEAYKASAELYRITYERDKAQYAVHAVSKQTLETDYQNWQGALGQVAQQTATVEKKTIRAPFTGHLGVSAVNPGQYLNPGDKIVNLQMLDPIYVDFYVPQQSLAQLKMGQKVTIKTDTYPDKVFIGAITTVDPGVDTSTRNVEVEATVRNPDHFLAPGMFTTVEVESGEAKSYLTVPQSAVSYNPYGNLVYLVRKNTDENIKADWIVKQVFVITGQERGDQVQILKGIKEGDVVVSSGQLKLRNGSPVIINNKVTPSGSENPVITQED